MSNRATTAIELQPVRENAVLRERELTATNNDDDTISILEASRRADSNVPDGGYGWVIVGSCAVLAWWTVGTSYCWGIIQSALVEDGVSSPAKLSFVGSLALSFISTLALVNSRLTRLIGLKYLGIAAMILIGGGQVLSSFVVRDVKALFGTIGVMTGLGTRWVSTCSLK
jgi:hypothetical protein